MHVVAQERRTGPCSLPTEPGAGLGPEALLLPQRKDAASALASHCLLPGVGLSLTQRGRPGCREMAEVLLPSSQVQGSHCGRILSETEEAAEVLLTLLLVTQL